eukprot:4557302-Pleurochrysis_carterae.AAC.3
MMACLMAAPILAFRNYNKSRIHSFRGARHVEIRMDQARATHEMDVEFVKCAYALRQTCVRPCLSACSSHDLFAGSTDVL